MPRSASDHANQPSKRQSSGDMLRKTMERPIGPFPRKSSSIDDEIGAALALPFAELMGFGLGSFGDDYSKALLTVTHSLIEHLSNAKASCRAMRDEIRQTWAGTAMATSATRARDGT